MEKTQWPEAQVIADLLCEAVGIEPVRVEVRQRDAGFWRRQDRLLVLPTRLTTPKGWPLGSKEEEAREAALVGYIAHELSHAVVPTVRGATGRRIMHCQKQRDAETRICAVWDLVPKWGRRRYALSYGPKEG